MVKFAFGDDTEIFRYVQSHGNIIGLVIVKYATKVAFIVVSTVVDYLTEESMAGIYYATAVFFIPTIGLGLVTLMSLGYIKSFVKPYEHRDTPLKNVVRVYVAAIRKRHLPCPRSVTNVRLYEGDPGNQMKRTDSLRFLEKAAIIESTEPEEERRRWRLSTITEVEETKCLLRMASMCMTFLAYGMVKSMGNTFFLLQGNDMNTTLGHIDVPLQTLTLIGEITGSGIQGLYTLLISKRLTGSGKRYGPPVKYTIGLVLATFCCTVASWIAKEKDEIDSVFWLTPQFILFGAMSGITRGGIEGFFHDQLPPSMVRYDSVFTDAMIGAGATFSIGLVFATDAKINTRSNYHMGGVYRTLTVASFVILSFYTFIATRYHYQDNEETSSN
ncbi:NRT1/ PTR FAMILY 5.5-like [Thalictrum thalictroides]|uniref:NRT1/ PTR FAMILY 5.5-like n=1 Tax=Thalictrum thalictroides TaxID=46969 RepID=A0A7J6V4P4_THATH|nr:NRT1/ PTR FAMILY 5.5-like [Thalictrum thalictroides]